MISTYELALINFFYDSSIGDNTTSPDLQEKILSYSNSYSYSLKNILQFISSNNNKNEFVFGKNTLNFFKYIYFQIILNLLRKGNSSLAVYFVKLMINNFSFKNLSTIIKNTYETYETVLNFLFEILDYNFDYSLNTFYEIIYKFKALDHRQNEFDSTIELVTIKYLSLSGEYTNFIKNKYNSVFLESSQTENKFKNSINIYYKASMKYYLLLFSENEEELLKFKDFCKENKLHKFKYFASILLASLYMKHGKLVEALFIINKTIEKNQKETNYINLKAKLVLCNLYCKMKDITKVKFLLNSIQDPIEKNGNMLDKYNFYSVKSQISLLENSMEIFKESILECFFYSILTNNSELINQTYLLFSFAYNRDTPLVENVNECLIEYIDEKNKLLKMFTLFNLNALQEIELLKVIQSNNEKHFYIIKNIIN